MGSYISVHNNTHNDLYIVYGPKTEAFRIAALVTAALGILIPGVEELVIIPELVEAALGLKAGLSLADLTIASIRHSAEKHGYHKCSPGNSYMPEKLTPTWMNRANIFTYNKISETQIEIISGSLILFTPPTANRVRIYKLTKKLAKTNTIERRTLNIRAMPDPEVKDLIKRSAPLVYKSYQGSRA